MQRLPNYCTHCEDDVEVSLCLLSSKPGYPPGAHCKRCGWLLCSKAYGYYVDCEIAGEELPYPVFYEWDVSYLPENRCPECHADLWGDDIPEYEREHYQPPYKWRREIAIYDRDLDCTVAWKCPDCNHRWSRAGFERFADPTRFVE